MFKTEHTPFVLSWVVGKVGFLVAIFFLILFVRLLYPKGLQAAVIAQSVLMLSLCKRFPYKCVPTSGAVEYIASSLNSFWRHSSGGTQKALLCFQHALNWLLSFFSVQNLAQRILPVPITRQTLCDCRLSWLVIWGVTAQRENMVISNAVSWVGSELTVLSRILRLYAGAVGSHCLR